MAISLTKKGMAHRFEGAWRIITRKISLTRLAHVAEPDTLLHFHLVGPNDINIEEALEKHRAITRPPPTTLSYPNSTLFLSYFRTIRTSVGVGPEPCDGTWRAVLGPHLSPRGDRVRNFILPWSRI